MVDGFVLVAEREFQIVSQMVAGRGSAEWALFIGQFGGDVGELECFGDSFYYRLEGGFGGGSGLELGAELG
jgi:hypothetical protein